ncbi:MAG: hypothetical protein K6T34_02840 [Thermoflavifilum sp.]|nr:hypothetical protein [Thermoflavifilum sp.]
MLWRKLWLGALGFMLLRQGVVFAQQPQIKVYADSSSILIGEQFHVYLDITLSPAYRLQGYALPDSFNHVEVVRRHPGDTLLVNGEKHFQQVFTLTSFDSGRWVIPAFPVVFTSANPIDTVHLILQTDSLWITVHTVPVDTTQPFRPIHKIWPVKLTWKDFLPYIVALLLLALLIIVASYIWRHRRKKAQLATIQQPAQPPYEEAMQLLKQMLETQSWMHVEMKMYFTQLTDVLRRYIERAFQIPAMEMTSAELLQSIQQDAILQSTLNEWKIILQEADQVKFAKWLSAEVIAEDCLHKAIHIVETTHRAQEAQQQVAHQKAQAETQ